MMLQHIAARTELMLPLLIHFHVHNGMQNIRETGVCRADNAAAPNAESYADTTDPKKMDTAD